MGTIRPDSDLEAADTGKSDESSKDGRPRTHRDGLVGYLSHRRCERNQSAHDNETNKQTKSPIGRVIGSRRHIAVRSPTCMVPGERGTMSTRVCGDVRGMAPEVS